METAELQGREYRTQVRRWWVETGWTDGNGIGLWDSTEKSIEVPSLKSAEALRDDWVAQGLLVATPWGTLRPPSPYGCFRIRCEWEDVDPSSEVLRLRAEQAQTLAANAALVAEVARLRYFDPTDAQCASACLSYRHDFGLLPEGERLLLMFQAREWLLAWRKELTASSAISPAAGNGGV